MFKNHLAMIGLNESPNKKAKFWQSYIRSLKGSDDIRANEAPTYRRPFSFYDDMDTAAARIHGAGYRYLPVHRETYGYSPRPIYAPQYIPTSRSTRASTNPITRVAEAEKAFAEHLERMKDIDRRYPSRYGLYLRDKPHALVEYEPDTKPY